MVRASPGFPWRWLAHLHTAQPLPDRQEGLLGCEVIHDDDPIGLSEELLGDAAVPGTEERAVDQERVILPPEARLCGDSCSPLLPSCVPQLQGHLGVVHSHCLHAVINACNEEWACWGCSGARALPGWSLMAHMHLGLHPDEGAAFWELRRAGTQSARCLGVSGSQVLALILPCVGYGLL